MNKIRKGDEVVVITGKDRNKRGTVTQVLANGKAVVGGINMVKKHEKGNPQLNQPGGIVSVEMPIQLSNLMVFNPATGKGDRVGFRVENDQKVRFFKSNNATLA
jgi:large subunit ribosomal protein L24